MSKRWRYSISKYKLRQKLDMKKSEIIYSLSFVCRLLNVSPHLLRAWEKRYQCVTPQRKANGRRTYSEQEITRLSYLVALTQQGHSISDIARLNFPELKKLHGKEINFQAKKSQNETPKATISNLLLALEHYNLEIIDHELKSLKKTIPSTELVFDYLLPLIQKLGEKVYKNDLGIDQEHALTILIRSHFYSEISQTSHKSERAQKRFILTTPEGEFHEFGILLAAILLKAQGHEFHYLGPNLPAKALLYAQEGLKSHTIILGLSLNYLKEGDKFAQYLKELSKLPPHVELLIGGHSPIKILPPYIHHKNLKDFYRWIKK